MGTITKSGQAGFRNGTTGSASNTSKGSTGTTHYSLNPGGGLVTTQWLIAGVPFSQTLVPGDTIQHSWTLGRTGTTSYNMGPGGTKTLKYTLDPGGNITESNGRMTGKSGTSSYTLGPGSTSSTTATLQPGSTQTYTVGTGGSATIDMVVGGIPQTVTLGPGDSSETTIVSGAEAVIETASTYDSTTPPEENVTYAVGDDGSTDNTWGDTTWEVWLFQPYNRIVKVDYDPICVVMPQGSYEPGCPGVLPSFITDYPAGTNCRYIRVGTATYSLVTGWRVNQEAIGTLTFPTNEWLDEDAAYDKVNQFELRIVDVEGVPVLKVASGAHIYRAIGTLCDETAFTDTLTADPSGPSPVDIVTGTGSSDPWAQSDGYVNISAGIFYVYAVKVESSAGVQFYLYVSKSASIDEGCPKTLPPGITEPSGEYTVQVLQVGNAVYEAGVWTVHQNLVGSITWPAVPVVEPEQFEVKVATVGSATVLKVARGNVYAGNGYMTANNHDYVGQTLTINHLGYKVKNFAVYPTGTVTSGTETSSAWANDNGYAVIDNTVSASYGVFLIRSVNKKNSTSVLSGGKPYLAIMQDSSDATTKTAPWYFQGIQQWVSLWVHSRVELTVDSTSVDVHAEANEPISYGSDRWANCLVNYNCQRIRIATVYWDGIPGSWHLTQHVKGPITIPHPYVFNGIARVQYDAMEAGYPSYFAAPSNGTEQNAWEGSYSGHTKWDGTGVDPTETLPV